MVLVCLVTITLRGGQNFGSNLFNNVKVTSSSVTESVIWTYENTKYWPTEGNINFLAYAPYLEGKTLKDNTSCCIDFRVDGDVTNQNDLLWANAKNQTKANNSGTNKVEFTFNHALAKIGYTVKLNEDYSNATITLNKITLAGSANEKKNAFYTAGTIDLSKTSSDTKLWETSPSDVKQNFDWFSGTQPATTITSASTSNPDTDYLFVIPQDFSQKTENADELYVIVEYTINYKTGEPKTMTNKVYQQIKMNFLQGKAYTINLTIGLTPIEFNAVVNDWEPGDKIDDIIWK